MDADESGIAPATSDQQQLPTVFILCPPRSGSTLLRVMLAGNPDLFAPPELELLSFVGMKERKRALSIRHEFMLGGLQRAVMALKGCSAEAATSWIESREMERVTTRDVYDDLRLLCGKRILVDKSVHYAISPRILERAERYFQKPLYLDFSVIFLN